MKVILIFSCLFLTVFGESQTFSSVEEAWKHYQATPLDRTTNPDYVTKIEDFEVFKRQWDEAYKFIEDNKNQTTRESWNAYKVNLTIDNFMQFYTIYYNFQIKNNLHYSPDEDEMRYQLIKMKWEEIFQHNMRYAAGAIYYPIYTTFGIHMTDAEILDQQKKPIIEPYPFDQHDQPFEKI